MANKEEMCDCRCHDDGVYIMHCMPCCPFTGKKRSEHEKPTEEKPVDQ